MLDRDPAELYNVKPIQLREQVKRNMDRFPENFVPVNGRGNRKDGIAKCDTIQTAPWCHFPYVFTEHGVLMLANVLRSERAIQVSIRIIEIFVKMRKMLSTNKDILLKLEQLEKKSGSHDADIQLIFEYLRELLSPPQEPRNIIGFTRHGEVKA
ncbi:ORF6N domain-containing protein [Chitinophaga sp. OAE865]|uniref:ORF6N domain-containing protein n=1 Tax=Chitinophaga sp. OAE865 TaxID=2817898 RepID=UPI001AE90710